MKVKEVISMIDLDILKDRAIIKAFAAKHIILREGATEPYSMFIVLSGKAEVWRNFTNAQRTQLATLEPGEFFGEMSLFLKEPRSATVIAATDVTLLELTPLNAMAVIKQNPELPYGLLALLCRRIQSLNKKVNDLSKK